LGVAALQALQAYIGTAQRWRGGLHPHNTGFSHQHGNIAGTHSGFFFYLFTVNQLDPHRLFVGDTAGTGGLHHDGFYIFVIIVVVIIRVRQ
jgi:hypothetical protein